MNNGTILENLAIFGILIFLSIEKLSQSVRETILKILIEKNFPFKWRDSKYFFIVIIKIRQIFTYLFNWDTTYCNKNWNINEGNNLILLKTVIFRLNSHVTRERITRSSMNGPSNFSRSNERESVQFDHHRNRFMHYKSAFTLYKNGRDPVVHKTRIQLEKFIYYIWPARKKF